MIPPSLWKLVPPAAHLPCPRSYLCPLLFLCQPASSAGSTHYLECGSCSVKLDGATDD